MFQLCCRTQTGARLELGSPSSTAPHGAAASGGWCGLLLPDDQMQPMLARCCEHPPAQYHCRLSCKQVSNDNGLGKGYLVKRDRDALGNLTAPVHANSQRREVRDLIEEHRKMKSWCMQAPT